MSTKKQPRKTRTPKKAKLETIPQEPISKEYGQCLLGLTAASVIVQARILPVISKKFKRLMLLAVAAAVAALAYIALTNPLMWAVESSAVRSRTYPYATVLGNNAGKLDNQALTRVLSDTKATFDSHKYTLVYGGSMWKTTTKELGFALDEKATAKSIWKLNDLPVSAKARLVRIREGGHSVIQPALFADSHKCQEKLVTIISINKAAKDASLYFDKQIQIKPDEAGVVFNAAETCQKVARLLQDDTYASKVVVDSTSANITKAALTAKLSQVVGWTGRPFIFTNSAYSRTVGPEELLSFLVVSREPGKQLSVTWDEGKLDGLAADIASHIDTFTYPTLSGCEVLVSSGGTRLDRQFVKDTVKSGKPDNYSLKTSIATPVTRHRTAATDGTKGVVYLTYDDGMAAASTILDYASCYGVKVTFFEIGSLANTDASLLRRAVAEGHSVQTHGYTHAAYDYGTGHDYSWQYNDIRQSIDVITSITGIRPTYFRPPGGNHTPDTYRAAADNGVHTILWDTSSVDTAIIGSSAICANVVNGARAGYSVLMHSSKQKTADAMPCIVEGLAAKGYSMQALR